VIDPGGRPPSDLAGDRATMGGNVRVGLEDSIYLGPAHLARSDAEQVRKIRTIQSELSLEIASASDARGLLKLKGGDSVGF
jgi:uncharacterized protein (DUF849 family)